MMSKQTTKKDAGLKTRALNEEQRAYNAGEMDGASGMASRTINIESKYEEDFNYGNHFRRRLR